jgi:hypothetical protein
MSSSNLRTTGVNLTFGTACVFALLAFAEALAALMSEHWFIYAATSTNSLSLWSSCTGLNLAGGIGGNCTEFASFSDINRGICTLTGSEVQGRIYTLRGLLIAGAILLITFVFLVVVGMCCDSAGTISSGVVCSVVSIFCMAAVIGLWYQTCESYFFCGHAACDYYSKIGASGSCFTMYGGPFSLVWTAGTASLLATILAGVALYRMRAPGRIMKLRGRAGVAVGTEMSSSSAVNGKMPRPPGPAPAPGSARSASASFTATSNAAAAAPTGVRSPRSGTRRVIVPPLAEWRMDCGDYQWDANSGYYFSDAAKLYYDDNSKMFFDPQVFENGSGTGWFDPADMRWY